MGQVHCGICEIGLLFIVACISYVNSDGSLGFTSVLTPSDASGTSDADVSQRINQIPREEFTLPDGTDVSVKDAIFYAKEPGGGVMTCTYKQFIQWNLSITTTYWDTSLPSGAHLGGQGPPRWTPEGRHCYQEYIGTLSLHLNTLLNKSQEINFIIEVVVTDRFHCTAKYVRNFAVLLYFYRQFSVNMTLIMFLRGDSLAMEIVWLPQ